MILDRWNSQSPWGNNCLNFQDQHWKWSIQKFLMPIRRYRCLLSLPCVYVPLNYNAVTESDKLKDYCSLEAIIVKYAFFMNHPLRILVFDCSYQCLLSPSCAYVLFKYNTVAKSEKSESLQFSWCNHREVRIFHNISIETSDVQL